jgi:cold shock protein
MTWQTGPRLPILRSVNFRSGKDARSAAAKASVRHLPKSKLIRPAIRQAVRSGEQVMPSGTVKWFNPSRGFGFIQPDDGSRDVFVHVLALERSGLEQLIEGQKVEFDLEQGQNGKLAAAHLKAG